MKPSLHTRKLLQHGGEDPGRTALSPTTTFSPDPLLETPNGSSFVLRRPLKPNTPFDSSMALTVLVLLTALFFMGFFSVYIRRFADQDDASTASEVRRRRNPSPTTSSWTRPGKTKGLDPSMVQALPLVSYRGDAKKGIGDCVICLTEFEDTETVKMIPYCRHVFHQPCIDTWLASHVSCPLCRSTQLLEKGGEVCLDVPRVDNDLGAS